jgi:hypothetical protein
VSRANHSGPVCTSGRRICARLVARCARDSHVRAARGSLRGGAAHMRACARRAALGTGREAGSPRSVSRSIRGRSSGGHPNGNRIRIGTHERLAAHPARTDARRSSVPGPHGRSPGERPRRSATPPPAPYLEVPRVRDPDGSCAGAPSRAWLQQRRLRSPAHCVGTRSRRLGLGAEDRVARRFARGGWGASRWGGAQRTLRR